MQSAARTYSSKKHPFKYGTDRVTTTYRYRYRVSLKGRAWSTTYVDSGACQKLLARAQETWPSAALQRIRQFLDERGHVVGEEIETLPTKGESQP